MATVKDLIDQYAAQVGMSPTVAETISYEESGMSNSLSPTQEADGSLSYGPFQLNTRGQGSGMSLAQLTDPTTNVHVGIDNLLKPYQQGVAQGLTGYSLVSYVASHSGHPGYTGTLPASYNTQLKQAYAAVTGGKATSGDATSGGGSGITNGSSVGGSPSIWNPGSIIRFSFWSILGIVLIGLGAWVLLNPFSDVTGAIRSLAGRAAKAPLKETANRIDRISRPPLKDTTPTGKGKRRFLTTKQIMDEAAKSSGGFDPFDIAYAAKHKERA